MKKRVDVELDLEILAWYSSEATKLGMSRRQYMTKILEKVQDCMEQSPNISLRYAIFVGKTPEECTTTKPELDGYTVKKTHIGVMDAQQLRDKGVDVENLLEKGLLKKLE